MSDRRHDEDHKAEGGSARYGQRSGSGANEPKRHERKEQREDWVPRQGGDQTRTGDTPGKQDQGRG
jgi:hypothetical protein